MARLDILRSKLAVLIEKAPGPLQLFKPGSIISPSLIQAVDNQPILQHTTSYAAETHPKKCQLIPLLRNRRRRYLPRGKIFYNQLPDHMKHIRCLRSRDPGRGMQGVEPDFGVDVALEFSNRGGFFEYVAGFSGILDDTLDFEESLKDGGSVLFGHEVPVCCDVDCEPVLYVAPEGWGWPGIVF